MKDIKGITLIVLIVTIIVLLILAGVSISMLAGDNGVLHQATNSKEESRAASVEEARDIWKLENKIDEVSEEKKARLLDEVLTELESSGLITSEERVIIEQTGKVTIANREIEFLVMEELFARLSWDFVNKQMIISVNFKKNNYDYYAREILKGKTQEEIEEIFIEGENYWNKKWDNGAPEFSNFEEMAEYWATQGDTFTTTEEMAEDMGYLNFEELAIGSRSVKYEEFLNQDIQGTITFPDGTTARVSRENNAEYIVNADGTYNFFGITDDGKMGSANITTEYEGKYSIFGNGWFLDECSGSVFLAYGYNQECEISVDNVPILKKSTGEEISLVDYINSVSYYNRYYVRVYDLNSYNNYITRIGEIGTVTFAVDGNEISWVGRFVPEIPT